jgi:HEAT repeat protein
MPIIKKTQAPKESDETRNHRRDLAGLLVELDDENPLARRWAARDLVNYPAACAALIARLSAERNNSVREVLFTSLTCIGSKEAVLGMITCLRSEDAGLRNEAIEAIKQLPDVVAPLMYDLLADTDPTMRLFAVSILVSLAHPGVEQWLLALLQRETDVNVCAAALDVLVEIGSPVSQPAIEAVRSLFPDEPYIQFVALLALQRIGKV